jgi:hypothetical protein
MVSAMALTRLSAVLVVAAVESVPDLALQRLLDDEPGRQLDQLRAVRRRCQPALDQAERTSRVRIDAGILFSMDAPWAWAGPAEPVLIIHPKDAPQPEFPDPMRHSLTAPASMTSRDHGKARTLR